MLLNYLHCGMQGIDSFTNLMHIFSYYLLRCNKHIRKYGKNKESKNDKKYILVCLFSELHVDSALISYYVNSDSTTTQLELVVLVQPY